MTVDIIGAGIGGLTTAIALEKKGFKIRIFEQAKEIKPVGAGIILANNAMQVYDKLGLRKIIEEHGNNVSSMRVTKANLSTLSHINLSSFEEKYNTKNIAIHRGELQQILIDKLKTTKIKTNHKLISITKKEDGYQLNFNDNKQIQSAVIIAADGINSTIRKELFLNNNIRKANQICWRGVVKYDLPTKYKNELNEAWDKSGRFGFVQISDETVYWYALKTFNQSKNEFTVDKLNEYYSEFNPVIKNLIKSTNKQQINTAEISDLKPNKNWYKKNICLIGDAAHAATPNMGQGACQAIEDAYTISECLSKYDINTAFDQFKRLRIKKTHSIVKMSWNIGEISHLKNPILIGIRNLFLKLTPDFITKKQNEKIFKLIKI